jgi:glutaredoxin
MSPIAWLRWWRSAADLKQMRVVLYTRHGCHLCEDAAKLLQDAQSKYGFRIDVVDVDSDPNLVAQHGEWVPVVTVDGKVRFRGGVRPALLTRLLRAEAKRRKRGAAEGGPSGRLGGTP